MNKKDAINQRRLESYIEKESNLIKNIHEFHLNTKTIINEKKI
jgi:hypothetical protein